MKKLYILLVMVFTFLMVSAGNATSTDDQGAMDFASPSNQGKHMSEMMGGMHGKGMMHQGTMGHHMMHSGMSPITFVVYPGMMPMMPMMQHSMMPGDAKGGHNSGGMSQQDMVQRQNMMKNHMERMEQRLANIEALLGELVELQKANQ